MFPVIVKGQREAAKLNNVMPEMTKLTNRMNEAKQSGNKFDCKCLIFLYTFFLSLFLPLCCQSVQMILSYALPFFLKGSYDAISSFAFSLECYKLIVHR